MTVADHEGEENPDPDAAPTNGNDVWTDGNSTTYRELDYVNLRFTITSSGRAAGFVDITFDTLDEKCLFYDGTFAGGWIQDPVGGVRPVGNPSEPGSGDFMEEIGGLADDDANASLVGVKDLGSTSVATVKVEFENAGSARFYYHLRLSDDAGACTGVKLVKLGNADPANIPNDEGDDFANVAARTVPHPAKDVLQNPSITVRKFIPDPEGGWQPAPADSWEFCGDKGSLLGGDACKNNPAVWNEVIAETTGTDFTFTENQLVGPEYQFDYVDGENCVQDGTTAVATVKADFNTPQNAVCNFYNIPAPGTLQLVKRVVNDDGGTAEVGAFGLNTTAGALTFGSAVEGPDDTFTYSSNVLTVDAGSYTLRENDIAGYTEGTWSCTGATANPTSITAGAVTVPNGGTVVCTITNNDQAGTLQIVKKVVNDNGGSATVEDFGLATSAGTLKFGDAVEGPTDTFTYTSEALTVNAGTYTLRENDADGYREGSWTCTGATSVTSAIRDGSVTLANGDNAICTITNNDEPGTLKIVKRVVNDDGGTAEVGAFGLNTTAGALTFGSAVEGPDDTFTYSSNVLTVDAGSYTLRENDIAGYTEGTWSCTGATANPTSITAGAVTVPNGGTVVCTITNNDQAGTLQIVKKVVNDNGGSATVEDFGLATSAGTLKFGDAVEGPTDTFTYTSEALTVNAGTYTLRENDADGYREGSWTCTGATSVTSAIRDGSVTLANGDNAICTITNNDEPGTLKIVKRVVNDDGGTAEVGAFGLNTTAGALTFGSAVEGPDDTFTYSSNVLTVDAGSYTLRENDIAGYTEGTWSCTGATANPTSITAGAVTVPNGGTVVCTITNNDQAGTLQIVKKVVNDNGGSATVEDFGLATSAGTLKFGDAVEGPTDTFTYTSEALTVNAGTYTLRENDADGYREGSWTCTGATSVTSAIRDGSVTLANGDNAICTITNNDEPGTLKIVKRVVNDDGGTAEVGAFGLNTTAGALTFGSAVEGPDDTFTYSSNVLTVDAGSYTLRENDIAGYTEGTWSCTGATANPTSITAGAVTVPNGGTVVCTITNNDVPGSIEVTKVDKDATENGLEGAEFRLWNDANGNGKVDEPDDKPIDGTLKSTDENGKATWSDLVWGAYLVQEVTPPTGYALSDPAIQAAVINAALDGGTVKLTFANPRLLGSIEVTKVDKDATENGLEGAEFRLWNDANGNGKVDEPDDKPIDGTLKTTGEDGKATWSDLVWGAYLVQEVTPPTGYALSDPAIQAAVINAALDGGTVKLTFANPRLLGSIEVTKVDKDATENGLEGAEFRLWNDANGNGKVDEPDDKPIDGTLKSTDEDGKATWSDLVWGAYLVQEVTPPTGYALSDPAIQAAVINAALDGGTVKLTFANPRLLGSIEVTKVDKDATENGLEGAEFRLWNDANGNGKVDEPDDKPIDGTLKTTGEDGKATWSDLVWGAYLVQEVTPPTGYALSDPAIQAAVINAALDGGTVKLTFANPRLPGAIEVTKVDEGTEAPLAGAEFQLWADNDESGDFTEGDTVIEDTLKTTGEDGKAKWTDLAWGYYLVQEVTPPTGYALSDPAIQAAVINAALDGGTVELTFANPRLPGAIEVIKVDDNQTPMGNVTFELFSDANDNGVVDAGESLGQKTTLADGSVTWTDLVWADDYKVVEVSWPSGYVPSGPVVTGPYTIDAENLLVTVNRVNNRIDIPKLDKSSVPAEGTAVQAGNTIAYTIEVKNDGALPLTGQTLLDTLPTGVALDVATVNPAGDTSVAGQITWKFDLGAYSAKTFTYTVTVTAGFGSPNLVNTATWVERKLTDKTEHPVLWPIMSLDKSADPAEGEDVSPGNTITYSVLVTNTGTGSFSGPMVDTLPVGFTADAASVAASGGVLSADGRSITWTVTLAANSSATFTYSGTVDETATADLVNTVVLTTPTGPISDSTTHPIAPVAPIEEEVVGGTEDLAKTGADYIAPLVTAALLALLAGGLMVVFGRRRRYNA